jgi:hypothetical protein
MLGRRWNAWVEVGETQSQCLGSRSAKSRLLLVEHLRPPGNAICS